VELAASGGDGSSPLKLEHIVVVQAFLRRFLQKIMEKLRAAGLGTNLAIASDWRRPPPRPVDQPGQVHGD
jgi:hypothetical protein